LTPIEIPVASPLGKLLVLGCSLLVAVAVLCWAAPKFTQFLKTVFDRSPSNPKMTPLHIAMGFLIYAIVFLPVAIASFAGVGIATTPPTRITPTGVTGGTFVCTGTRLVLSFSCSFQFSFIHPQTTLPWNEIERVECVVRQDRTVSTVYVYSRTQRIEIGSFARRDLSGVHDVLAANVPPGATRPCRTGFGESE
jgi:hypothetical protein